ncbi:MAG: hypothetical protein WBW04_00325 [Nitrolancea sp.]
MLMSNGILTWQANRAAQPRHQTVEAGWARAGGLEQSELLSLTQQIGTMLVRLDRCRVEIQRLTGVIVEP